MTTRELISRYLARKPNQTATQVARGIKKSVGLVSGILQSDASSKKVYVSRSKGPRGGVVYKGYKAA
jgi:hypothetical protein